MASKEWDTGRYIFTSNRVDVPISEAFGSGHLAPEEGETCSGCCCVEMS